MDERGGLVRLLGPGLAELSHGYAHRRPPALHLVRVGHPVRHPDLDQTTADVLFFRLAADGQWVREHPGTFLLGLEDAFDVGGGSTPCSYAAAALEREEANNQRLVIGGPDAISWRDAVAAFEHELGREIPVRTVRPGEPIPGMPELDRGHRGGLCPSGSPAACSRFQGGGRRPCGVVGEGRLPRHRAGAAGEPGRGCERTRRMARPNG